MDLSKGAKVCFLGEAGVGKSSIVSRYVKDILFKFFCLWDANIFDDHQPPTVGAAFLSKIHQLKNGKMVKFDLWDTAGKARSISC